MMLIWGMIWWAKDYDREPLASWQWDKEVEIKPLHEEVHVWRQEARKQ